MFKKDDYIVCLNYIKNLEGKENYCYKLIRDQEKVDDSLYFSTYQSISMGRTNVAHNIRYATPEEIVGYDRLGKPYDVTTLAKLEKTNLKKLLDGEVVIYLDSKEEFGECNKITGRRPTSNYRGQHCYNISDRTFSSNSNKTNSGAYKLPIIYLSDIQENKSKDFVLPVNWHVVVTEENQKVLSKWRYTDDKTLVPINYVVGIDYYHKNPNSKGHNPRNSIKGDSFDFGIEITFDQFKKYVLKDISEPKVESKEVIPEYVELLPNFDNIFTGKIFNTKNKLPNSWNTYKSWEWLITNMHSKFFKPSTKEAYDAQNQIKSVKEWSVGTYVVPLEDNIQNCKFKTGTVLTIKNSNKISIIIDDDGTGLTYSNSEIYNKLKWFATKSEAEEFAKTLVGSVKEEVREPLKQAVHCKTQEEWNFVKDKLCSKNCAMYKEPFHHDCAITEFNSYDSLEYLKENDYQILSFQEWCDLNDYKMENLNLPDGHPDKFKSTEEYSVGTYLVCFDYSSHYYIFVGDVLRIEPQDRVYSFRLNRKFFVTNPKANYSYSLKWFATLEEAEEFSKKLLSNKENNSLKNNYPIIPSDCKRPELILNISDEDISMSSISIQKIKTVNLLTI